MRKFWFVILMALWPFGTMAQDGNTSTIEGTIAGQITAFEADDFGAAFDFASPMIKRLFRSADNFGTMVRRGYPMVWRPSSFEFLNLRNENGRQIQRVLIRDQGGAIHILDYEMIQGANGWLINGVSLLDAQGASA